MSFIYVAYIANMKRGTQWKVYSFGQDIKDENFQFVRFTKIITYSSALYFTLFIFFTKKKKKKKKKMSKTSLRGDRTNVVTYRPLKFDTLQEQNG